MKKKKNKNSKKRNVNKYLIVLICFIIVMSLALVFFMFRLKNISLRNDANHLLKDLYRMDSGTYSLKDGILYQNEYKVASPAYFLASGDIEIDKYKNVRFNLSYDGKCISKTYEGTIDLKKGNCNSFKTINVKINKNNNKISFISDTKNLEYKISYEDDYVGEWIKEDYKDNIVLKSYNDGVNYIWFKDSKGNISDTLSFKIDCLNTTKATYDNKVFYCSGSTVKLDNMDFVVVKDTATTITLMKFLPIENKMSHCVNDDNKYCNLQNDNKNTYNWKNSYINYYLNNEFINNLSNETIKSLVDNKICIDTNSKCDDELCIGRSREEIKRRNYKCDKYTISKIKIISYDEFNYVYSKAENRDVLNGNYWSINSFTLDKGTSIQYDLSFYIYEELANKKDIKPVIILNK